MRKICQFRLVSAFWYNTLVNECENMHWAACSIWSLCHFCLTVVWVIFGMVRGVVSRRWRRWFQKHTKYLEYLLWFSTYGFELAEPNEWTLEASNLAWARHQILQLDLFVHKKKTKKKKEGCICICILQSIFPLNDGQLHVYSLWLKCTDLTFLTTFSLWFL